MNDATTQAPPATTMQATITQDVEMALVVAEQALPGMLAALAAGGWGPAAAMLKFLPAIPALIKAAETVATVEGVHLPDALQGVVNTITPGAPGAPSLQ